MHLGATVLPSAASAEELREACRALRGRLLRTEIYAEDETAQSVHPYATTEHRYQVTMLQPTARQAHAASDEGPPVLDYAAFFGYELESLSYSYERQPGRSEDQPSDDAPGRFLRECHQAGGGRLPAQDASCSRSSQAR